MFKSVIVHIGAGKTGTSAIQHFLRVNAGKLHDMGYVVGGRNLEINDESKGNQVWFFESLRTNVVEGRQTLNQRISDLEKHYQECHTLILSAENLSNCNGQEVLFQDLTNISVILYVRRQDEFLLSAWQQWYSKQASIFDEWWRHSRPLGDWKRVCTKWESVVGRRAMQVRVYDSEWFIGGNLLKDFLAACGCQQDIDKLTFPAATVNVSYSDAVTDLLGGRKRLFNGIHDNEFYELIGELTGNKFVKRKNETHVSVALRGEIVDSFASENMWVRDRYFPYLEGDQSLFRSVASEGLHESTTAEIENEKVEIVLSLIRELYRRVVALQKKVQP